VKKRIRVWLPILFAVYLVVFRFVLEPHSEAHWLVYGLVHELRMFLALICVLFALFSVRNWRFLLVWVGLAVASVVAVGHISWGSRPVAAGRTLKVLTYNVAAFGVDKAGVMKVLKESDADIICLQEAGKIGHIEESAKALSKELKGYYWSGASTNLILSRYPLVAEPALNVPTKWPTKEFPSAVVDSPLGKVRVMCVHMEPSWVAAWPPELSGYVGTISKVCEDRRAQVDLIMASLRPSKEPVILAGDFNGPAGSESILRFGKYFTDSFATTEKGFGNTILAKMPYKRIDYVWTRGLTPMQSEVVDSVASDHRAVLTVVGN
jgi:endonuclease/exonuclease/phosphatase (EEP) superfamily protein YafD